MKKSYISESILIFALFSMIISFAAADCSGQLEISATQYYMCEFRDSEENGTISVYVNVLSDGEYCTVFIGDSDTLEDAISLNLWADYKSDLIGYDEVLNAEFTIPKDGNYTLVIDNDALVFGSMQVDVTLTYYPPNAGIPGFHVGIILLCGLFSIAFIIKKTKRKTN